MAATRATTRAPKTTKAPAAKAAAKKAAVKKPAVKKAPKPKTAKDVFTAAEKKAPAKAKAVAAVKPAVTYPADPRTPPPLTGKVSQDGGRIAIDTQAGRFFISNRDETAYDSSYVFSGIDAAAFIGKVVTVRGWPSADWTPGQVGATLAVEEFAPGTSPNFLAGRVRVSGDDVFVTVRGDKQVIIDDPQLKAAFRNFDMLGVILPGTLERRPDGWHFTSAPKDYYVLGGFGGVWGGGGTPQGNRTSFSMQLAHGKSAEATVPTQVWDQTARDSRHYFFGHFDQGRFVGANATPHAGGWNTAGIVGAPNTAFRTAADAPVTAKGSFEP